MNALETFCRQVRARSVEHAAAMRLLAGARLWGQAVSILRQELDSLIRVIYLLSLSDMAYRQSLIEASVNDRHWTVKGKKARITDKEMAALAGRLHGWTASVYKFGCAFIHLSACHDYSDRDPFVGLPADEQSEILNHMRKYHFGPPQASPTFQDLTPYLSSILDKISSNLDGYVRQLQNNDVIILQPEALVMDNAAELFTKWQGWIDNELLRSFQDIFSFKHIWDGFNESLKPFTGTTPEWGDLVMWMSVNYIGNSAMAIRRLGDRHTDTISLHRLLADVKAHAAVVTPANLAAYRGNIGPREPVENVEATADSDMRLLAESGDSIRKFVNKMVAHAAEDAHTITPPTYGQFNDAIRIFHGVYRKWALFLAGSSCQTDDPNPNDLLPFDPPDYRSQFAKMWGSLGE